MKNKKLALILFIFMPIVFLFFHNCGKFTSVIQGNSLGAASCINNLQPVFKSTMYGFFNSHNCIECHSNGGASGKFFAHSNPSTAFQIFLTYGSDRVKSKLSQSGGHSGNNYNTNSQLKQSLDAAKTSWDNALNNLTCEEGGSSQAKSVIFFENTKQFGKYKVLQTMLTPQTVSWDIKSGLTIAVDIQVEQDEFNFPTHYYVSAVRAKSSNGVKYQIKKVKILLNGKNYEVTTFEGINKTIQGTGSFESIYEGSTAVFSKDTSEIYDNADKWSISADITP